MKIGTRLGIYGSSLLLAAFGITASASAHPRALAAGLFAQQQEEHPDDKKPEVNPPAHPRAQDEKKPEHPEDTKPGEHPEHPANAKPEERKPDEHAKPAAHPEEKKQTETRNETHTRTHQNVHYKVETKNVTVVKTHYREELTHVDRAHRPHWVVGGFIDRGQVTYIEPVPAEVIVGFPAAPAGLIWGYWEGYCILYDPNTLEIVYVIDLL